MRTRTTTRIDAAAPTVLRDRYGAIRRRCLSGFALTLLLPTGVAGYTMYSENRDATLCRSCHGDFRGNLYISPQDGLLWGNLHDLHRNTLLGGDCDACHIPSQDFPVPLDQSVGGAGLGRTGCMGCHGREEDNDVNNPSAPHGLGAGLRQHHTNAGIDACVPCHDDASPARYTPVGEDVLPTNYADPGTGHPGMPTGPCNADGSEDLAGAADGLDNDGDLVTDRNDADCALSDTAPAAASTLWLAPNWPNPFNPRTTIRYATAAAGPVRLRVLGLDGRLVRVLLDEVHAGPTAGTVTWDGRDGRGIPVASGVFLCFLETGSGRRSVRMTLLR
jgi:hypothetical protein